MTCLSVAKFRTCFALLVLSLSVVELVVCIAIVFVIFC